MKLSKMTTFLSSTFRIVNIEILDLLIYWILKELENIGERLKKFFKHAGWRYS